MHVIKRGARGMEIVRDKNDRWRFLKSLYYLNNNNYRVEKWERELNKSKTPLFTWPAEWPVRDKLVEINAFILMPNHFHLLLKEIRENGISLFMQGLSGSMTLSFNEKHQEKGSIFQGAYKGKLIDTDEYLKQVAVYIMVKNSFDLLPGGLEKAIKDFDGAWNKSLEYQFSSLADYGNRRNSPIIDRGLLGEIFDSPSKFKSFARDTILGNKVELDEE
jgi:putative transposase